VLFLVLTHVKLHMDIVGVAKANVIFFPVWIKLNPRRLNELEHVAATIEGTGLLIAFNVKYLREVLEVIKTPNVVLETSAQNAPGVIKPVGDENFLHVIMPMHLG
jgi:hypothetical protein